MSTYTNNRTLSKLSTLAGVSLSDVEFSNLEHKDRVDLQRLHFLNAYLDSLSVNPKATANCIALEQHNGKLSRPDPYILDDGSIIFPDFTVNSQPVPGLLDATVENHKRTQPYLLDDGSVVFPAVHVSDKRSTGLLDAHVEMFAQTRNSNKFSVLGKRTALTEAKSKLTQAYNSALTSDDEPLPSQPFLNPLVYEVKFADTAEEESCDESSDDSDEDILEIMDINNKAIYDAVWSDNKHTPEDGSYFSTAIKSLGLSSFYKNTQHKVKEHKEAAVKVQKEVSNISNLVDKLRAVWANQYLRVTTLTALAGYIIGRLVRYNVFSKALEFVMDQLANIFKMIPGGSKITDLWGRLKAKIFGPDESKEEKIDTSSENNEETSTDFGLYARLSAAVVTIFNCLTLDSFTDACAVAGFLALCKKYAIVTRGLKSLKSVIDWLVSWLPESWQVVLYSHAGIGSLPPGVEQLWKESQLLIRHVLMAGQGVFHEATFRKKYTDCLTSVVTMRASLPSGYASVLLQRMWSDLVAQSPAGVTQYGNKTIKSKVPVGLFGPPGLGKSYFVSLLGSYMSYTPSDAIWQVNLATKHDDGLTNQYIKNFDDLFSVDSKETENWQAMFLQATSPTVDLSNQASLGGKGTVDDTDFLTWSTNYTLKTFLEKFNDPRAPARRILTARGACFEFKPAPIVTTNGEPDPAKIAALSHERKRRWEHCEVYHVTKVGDRLQHKRCFTPEDAIKVVMNAFKYCHESDLKLMNVYHNNWKQNGKSTIILEALKKENKVLFPANFEPGVSNMSRDQIQAYFDRLQHALYKDDSVYEEREDTKFNPFDADAVNKLIAKSKVSDESYLAPIKKFMQRMRLPTLDEIMSAPQYFRDMVVEVLKENLGIDLDLTTALLGTVVFVLSYSYASSDKEVESTDLDFSTEEETTLVRVNTSRLDAMILAQPESWTKRKARGDRSKVAGKRPVTARSLLETKDVLSASVEMMTDVDAKNTNSVIRKIHRNILRLHNSHDCLSHGVAYGANCLVTTTHMFTQTNLDLKKPLPTPSLCYEIKPGQYPIKIPKQATRFQRRFRNGVSSFEVELSVDSFQLFQYHNEGIVAEIKKPGMRDVTLVTLPPGTKTPPMSTLINHFCTDKDVMTLEGLPLHILTFEGKVIPLGNCVVMQDRYWYAPARQSDGRLIERSYYVGANTILCYPGLHRHGHQAGWCGLPIVAVLNGAIKIVGIHVAQKGNSRYGMAIPITQTDLGDPLIRLQRRIVSTDFKNQQNIEYPLLAKSEFEADQELDCENDFGDLARAEGLVHQYGGQSKSKVYVSPLVNTNLCRYTNLSKTINTNLNYSFSKRLAPIYSLRPRLKIDYTLMFECMRDTIKRFSGKNYFDDDCSIAASAAGFRHPTLRHSNVAPLDLSTGAGARRAIPGKRGKKHCFVEKVDDEGHTYVEPDLELTRCIEMILENADEGFVTQEPVVNFFKDEACSESKADRPRVVRMFTTALTCATRKEFHGLFHALHSHHPHSESFLGKNPESRDFSRLIHRLYNKGGPDSFLDGDVHGMDDGYRYEVISLLAQAICSFYKTTHKNARRYAVFIAQFLRKERCGKIQLDVWGLLGSGTSLTTILNIILILSTLKYSFIMKQREVGDVATLAEFHRCVAASALGDDIIANVNRNLTSFEPKDFIRFGGYDSAGNRFMHITSANKSEEPEWLHWSQASFLSRYIGLNTLGLWNFTWCAKFSPKRFNKSLKWLRRGPLSESELIVTKLNDLLVLMLGHGPDAFSVLRSQFLEAMDELNIGGYLRSYSDCINIWDTPPECGIIHNCSVEMLSTISKISSNVNKVVQKSVDVVQAVTGLDNPNSGVSPTRFISSQPYLMNGGNQITNFQVMAMNSSVTRRPNTTNFGMSEDETTFESLCRPTWYTTKSIAVELDAPNFIIADGWLTIAPNIAKARLGEIIDPLACGFIASKFRTAKFDFVLKLDFNFPIVANMRIGLAALPMVSEIPTDIGSIQETYVEFRDIKQGSTQHVFVVPYQADTPRKRVPNGPNDLTNSFGRWVLFGQTGLATTESTRNFFQVNISIGAQNVTLDNFGMNNHTLTNVIPEGLGLVDAKVEMDTKGIGMQDVSSPPPDSKVPATSTTHATSAPESVADWKFTDLASRDQPIGTFRFSTNLEVGQTLMTLEVPDETIVGTHFTPFTRFMQMSDGVCVLSFRIQGQLNAVGSLIVCVVPGVSSNDAVRLMDSKVSQTFVSHQFLRPAEANVVEVRVPFAYWRDAHLLTAGPYATVVVKVFNKLDLGVNSTFNATTFSVYSRWENVNFSYINPVPSNSEEYLQKVRKNFVNKHPQNINRRAVRDFMSNLEFVSSLIQAKSEMMSVPVPNGVADEPAETKVTVSDSKSSESLDEGVFSVNQLCRRFQPVWANTSNQILEINTISLTELFEAKSRLLRSLKGPISYYAGMFQGFSGTIRGLLDCPVTEKIVIGFIPGDVATREDLLRITGVLVGNNLINSNLLSGFTPFTWLSTVQEVPGIVSNWITQQKYVRLNKFDPIPPELGSFCFSAGEGANNSHSTFYVAFSDNATFGLPVTVPRLFVNDENVLSDQYPSVYGSFQIGQFIEFRHLDAGTVFVFSQQVAEFASTAVPSNPDVPPLVTQRIDSFRIRSDLFDIQEFRDMGLVIPSGSTLQRDPEQVTIIELDLTAVRAVPVATNVSYDDTKGNIILPFTNQSVQIKGNLPNVDFGGITYSVGEYITVFPGWEDDFLQSVWSIGSDVAVPYPAQADLSFTPDAGAKFTVDGVNYAIINTLPPVAIINQNA